MECRNIRSSERFTFQLRGDAFNIFNAHHFNTVGAFIQSTGRSNLVLMSWRRPRGYSIVVCHSGVSSLHFPKGFQGPQRSSNWGYDSSDRARTLLPL
jgi:hypothetical protein